MPLSNPILLNNFRRSFEMNSNYLLNEGLKKDPDKLASELVEIAAAYVEIDLTPEMSKSKSIETEDELIEFYEELVETVAEDAAGPNITKFKKEAVSFLKKYGVKI